MYYPVLENINKSIFRESDIRGLVARDLHPDTVEWIGKAIGTYVRRRGGKNITVGRDVRESSFMFQESLTRGLLHTGCQVIDIGLVPTPAAYFSLYHLETDGGIMITGSHNPPEYNGFKISYGRQNLFGCAIQELYRRIEQFDFEVGAGQSTSTCILEAYKEKICDIISISRPLKVVVDGGNGCFGLVGPDILRRLGLNVVELFCQPDGSFPNHHPDPTILPNLRDLIQKVRDEKADLGIGFDGDADRIGVVDENGNVIWGDHILMILARDILKRNPGATIIGEVKCSQYLFEDIRKRGGVPLMTATGHSLIKKKMRDTGALLGGEMSGHFCFADNYFGFDDAIFAACRLLQVLADSPIPLSQILSDLPPSAYTPEIRIDCPDDRKFHIVREITEYLRFRYNILEIDGLRVQFKDGWALLRASNTQPALTLRFEASSWERLEEIQKIIYEPLSVFVPNLIADRDIWRF